MTQDATGTPAARAGLRVVFTILLLATVQGVFAGCEGRPVAPTTVAKASPSVPGASAPRPARPVPVDPRLDSMRHERSRREARLKSTESEWQEVRSVLDAGKDPPVVAQMVQENYTLAQYRQQAENYRERYEELKAQLEADHPRVLQFQKATMRSAQKADDYEAEVRVKARTLVKDQYAQRIAELKANLDELKVRIEELEKLPADDVLSRVSGGGS